MKVLMSSSDFLPNIGGLAAVVWELARALAAIGHDVQIVNWRFSHQDHLPDDMLEGIRIHRPVLQASRSSLLARLQWPGQIRKVFRRLYGTGVPDAIHVHTMYPDGFAARFMPAGPVRVFTNHTSGFLQALSSKPRRVELGWMLRGFDAVLAPSHELAERSRELGATRVKFIPNGVDTGRFSPGSASRAVCREKLGIEQDAKVILAARRFIVKNGLRYLAAAFVNVRRAVPDALLVFCGSDFDGVELAEVKRILSENGGEERVDFRGSVPNAEMPDYYCAADVCVLPSLVEATSVAGLEAMASGLPVVGTNVGGIPYIIEDGRTGVIVDPANSSTLAQAITALLQDENRRQQMGTAAARVARERFDWQAIARCTEGVYRSCTRA